MGAVKVTSNTVPTCNAYSVSVLVLVLVLELVLVLVQC